MSDALPRGNPPFINAAGGVIAAGLVALVVFFAVGGVGAESCHPRNGALAGAAFMALMASASFGSAVLLRRNVAFFIGFGLACVVPAVLLFIWGLSIHNWCYGTD